MNIEQLQSQIKVLLNIAKITPEEKTSLLERLPSASQDQLEKLRLNLMRQVSVDIFFDALEEAEKDNRIFDEEVLEEVQNKIIAKFEEVGHNFYTQSEITEIRQNLQAMQQKVAGSASAPSSESTIPQQAPVQNPPVVPVSPQTPQTDVPTQPPPTASVSIPPSPTSQVS